MIRNRARIDLALHEAMILFYHIVYVLARSGLAVLRYQVFLLQVTYSTDVGRVLVDINHTGWGNVWPSQHLAKETLGR